MDTLGWIADSLLTLREKLQSRNIAVWLETHGDFAKAWDVAEILTKTKQSIQVIWDPANAFEEFGESPDKSEAAFGSSIRHVHLKDVRKASGGNFEYTLPGAGDMPLNEVRAVLERLHYDGFVSFEWEKHWHPSLANPEVALPYFAKWCRENWLQQRT